MDASEKIKKMIKADSSIQSYADFARKSGVSKEALSYIFNKKTDRPHIRTIKKIAAYFNCDVTDIINSETYYEYNGGFLASRFIGVLLSKKVSFSDVSKATGISTSRLSAIKNKPNYSPKPATLEKLAKYFDVPVSYFTEKDEVGDKK